MRDAAQRDGPAQQARITAKPLPPETVADDRHVDVRSFILGGEQASPLRSHADHRQQTAVDVLHGELFRIALAGQRCPECRDTRHLLEDAIHFAPVQVITWRDDVVSLVARDVKFPDHDELLGIGIGELTQQQRVDDAEDRCVRADTKRQRDHRDQRKSRRFAKLTKREF